VRLHRIAASPIASAPFFAPYYALFAAIRHLIGLSLNIPFYFLKACSTY